MIDYPEQDLKRIEGLIDGLSSDISELKAEIACIDDVTEWKAPVDERLDRIEKIMNQLTIARSAIAPK